MDLESQNMRQLVPINAVEILNKYRKLQDRINFCFEKNWYHPKEVGFDANFFLMVLKGEKKYLPNNFTINYKLNYFRKGERLDKKYLIEKMKKNSIYALYTPDISDPLKFSKDFLLKLIAYNEPNLFKELYSINKKQNEEKNYNKWSNFKIDIAPEFINDINEFKSLNSGSKNYGGFKFSKNHVPTNIFYQFQGKKIENFNQMKDNQNLAQINQKLQEQLNTTKQQIFILQQKIQEKSQNNAEKNIILEDKMVNDGKNFMKKMIDINSECKQNRNGVNDNNLKNNTMKIKLQQKIK
jgi:hypothetical protein